jgi:hypothetical protein
MSRWPSRLLAAGTGVSFGIALGLTLPIGEARPAIAAALLVPAVLALAWRILPAEERPRLARVVLLALGVRFATAVVLRELSFAVGHEGWVTGDDYNYEALAWGFVQWFRGQPEPPYEPPDWNTDVYLFGTYVYLESVVFFVFGKTVLVMEFLNAAAMTVAGLVLFDIARGLFGLRAARWTLVLVLFYPSLVVWSSLNLKDAVSMLMITLALWLVRRFQVRPSWALLLTLLIVIAPVQTLRRYVYLLLLISLPAGIVLSATLRRSDRVWKGVAVAGCVVLFGADLNTSSWYGTFSPEMFESFRQGMGIGARTSYQRPLPVSATEGMVFVLIPPSPSPNATPVLCEPTTVVVPARAQLVIVDPRDPIQPPSGDTYFVRPCDTIVIGRALSSPIPIQVPQAPDLYAKDRFFLLPAPRTIEQGQTTAELRPAVRLSDEDPIARTLSYLPRGIAYALMAPFPWAIDRAVDALTIPEMLAWYAFVMFGLATLWRARHMWRALSPLVLFCLGLMAVLSLAEGNYGTLFRHRAMVIPFVVTLATPSVIVAADRIARRYALPARSISMSASVSRTRASRGS